MVALGHLFFLILTRPSSHNKNFPYHVRTTQIGIMEAMTSNTNLGNNTLDSFGHGGSYGVTGHNMDVFTVDSVANGNSRSSNQPALPPPPTYDEAAARGTTQDEPNGLPSWSIAKDHSNQNGSATNQNGNAKRVKIYDPNDDAVEMND